MTDTAQVLQKLRDVYRANFGLWSKSCVKVLDKKSNLVPFVMNPAQELIHAQLEKQKAEKGWVRALILKARRQGCSTYVQVRFYHQTTLWPFISTYIFSHEQTASDALFEIVERIQDNNPLAPEVDSANAKQLSFEKIKSSYRIATAGSKGTGRGQSNHLYLGSESAHWPNAAEHFAASVQTVPLEEGTEVVLETTANGPTGEFYKRWQEAEAGQGDYIAIFIPWFVSPEYARTPPVDFELSNEPVDGDFSEQEYAQMFGLSNEQMYWRRNKILELGSLRKFKQEYPATANEAFVSSEVEGAFISPAAVLRARKRKVQGGGPLIMGVDPAGAGGDRFSVAFRRGMCVEKVIYRNKVDTPEALAWLLSLIETEKPDKVFIDQGGLGAPIISMLRSHSPAISRLVEGVNFGGTSQHKLALPKVAGPKRRREEMWLRSKQWLEQDEAVSIPDMDELQTDATSVWVMQDLNNDLKLSSKIDMRKKGIRSPDTWDAVVLTFASSVYVDPDKLKNKSVSAGTSAPLQVGSLGPNSSAWSWMG